MFEWYDKYCENLFAKEFVKSREHYDVITLFEVFEHFVNPMDEIEKVMSLGNNVICMTSLIPTEIPLVGDWWYYAPIFGQHVAFYAERTMEYIAQKFSRNYVHCNDIHIFSAASIAVSDIEFCLRFPHKVHQIFKRKSLRHQDFKMITGIELPSPKAEEDFGGYTRETLQNDIEYKYINTSRKLKEANYRNKCQSERYRLLLKILRKESREIDLTSNSIVYGSGNIGKLFYDTLQCKENVACFVDKYSQEKAYRGCPIYRLYEIPLKLVACGSSIIITATYDYERIRREIELLYPEMRISSVDDYL